MMEDEPYIPDDIHHIDDDAEAFKVLAVVLGSIFVIVAATLGLAWWWW